MRESGWLAFHARIGVVRLVARHWGLEKMEDGRYDDTA
jgi:hypothetical protein